MGRGRAYEGGGGREGKRMISKQLVFVAQSTLAVISERAEKLNWTKARFPGSRRSKQSYILTHSRLNGRKPSIVLESQQREPRSLLPRYPAPAVRKDWLSACGR